MKIPDDMDYEDVLFLSDIFPTAYQAAEMGEINPGDTVVVFGCGPVGLLAQKCAKLQGAGRVIAVDRERYRIEFAESSTPGLETIDFSETKDVVGAIRKMTDGRGADVCIDAVGCEARGNALHTMLGAMLLEAVRRRHPVGPSRRAPQRQRRGIIASMAPSNSSTSHCHEQGPDPEHGQ